MANVIPPAEIAVGTATDAPLRPNTTTTYTVKEVADLLRLSLGGTYQAIRAGEIPAKRVCGRWIIPARLFQAWLDTQDNDPTEGHLAA